MKGELMKLYQYKPVNKYALLNLINNHIYCNVINRVNDPFEGHFAIDVKPEFRDGFIELNNKLDNDGQYEKNDFDECCRLLQEVNINYFLNDFGMSSFTTNKKSIPMWGNYADNHYGICIEFDSDKDIFQLAEPVDYTSKPFVLQIHSQHHLSEDHMMESIVNSMYTKHKDWEYEQEWRILKHANDKIEYDPATITAIYFGLRTTDIDIELVMNAVSHLPHIKFFKARKELGNPDIQFDEL